MVTHPAPLPTIRPALIDTHVWLASTVTYTHDLWLPNKFIWSPTQHHCPPHGLPSLTPMSGLHLLSPIRTTCRYPTSLGCHSLTQHTRTHTAHSTSTLSALTHTYAHGLRLPTPKQTLACTHPARTDGASTAPRSCGPLGQCAAACQ